MWTDEELAQINRPARRQARVIELQQVQRRREQAWAAMPWWKRAASTVALRTLQGIFLALIYFWWGLLLILFGVSWYFLGFWWGLTLALSALILGVVAWFGLMIRWLTRRRGNQMSIATRGEGYTARETVIFCAVLLAIIVVVAFLLQTGSDLLFTLALMCFGLAAGYAAGVFITPYGPREQTEFAQIGKFLSVLVSGFLLAKLEPAATKILSSDELLTLTNAFRLVSVTTCFLLVLITVFVHRKYVFSFNESDFPSTDTNDNAQGQDELSGDSVAGRKMRRN
jgi:hypothetical protein